MKTFFGSMYEISSYMKTFFGSMYEISSCMKTFFGSMYEISSSMKTFFGSMYEISSYYDRDFLIHEIFISWRFHDPYTEAHFAFSYFALELGFDACFIMKVKHCTLQQMNTFQEYRAFKGLENSNGTTSIAANYKQFLKLFLGKKTDCWGPLLLLGHRGHFVWTHAGM